MKEKKKLKKMWLISVHSTTDGKKYYYWSTEDGGTADVEVTIEDISEPYLYISWAY
mgnify:CR=1 FL=1